MGCETPFTVRVEARNGVARMALAGELDMVTAPVLNDELARAEQESVRTIMLDLRDLTFIDSSGLYVCIQARQRSDLNGHRFLIVGASPFTRRVFEVSGTKFLLDDADATGTLDRFTRGDGRARPAEAQVYVND